MSKTPFSKKCEILGNFWFLYKDSEEVANSPEWSDYFRWADVGLPMAYCIWQNLVTLKRGEDAFINEAWSVFCEMLGVDANAKYADVVEIFQTSPNPEIKNES